MSIEIRNLNEGELSAFFDNLTRVFSGNSLDPENFERSRANTELERTLGAFDGTHLVGTAGIFSFRMTVPGGVDLPAAGVTRVSVNPSHRRRGVLRAMMRRQLDDIHARGEPVAALFASEAPIYGRFGYGVGSWHGHLEIDRGRAAFRDPAADGRVRVVDADTALTEIPAVHDRLRLQQPGAVSRARTYWEVRMADPVDFRRGRSQNWYLLHDGHAGPDGFAIYRVEAKWQGHDPGGTLFVTDLQAGSPAATAALWRFCLDVDLMARLDAFDRPAEDSVRHLLADPRAARNAVYDGLWVRLVDVPAALAGRRYGAPGRLVLQVGDQLCPWNAGGWELESGPEGAECRPSRAEPDLVLDVADLGAAYLGGNRFTTLAMAGRVVAREPAVLQRADAMFAASPAPWCPTHF